MKASPSKQVFTKAKRKALEDTVKKQKKMKHPWRNFNISGKPNTP